MRQYGTITPIVKRSDVLVQRFAIARGRRPARGRGCSKADTRAAGRDRLVHAEQDARAARQPGRAHLSVRRRARRGDRRRLPRLRARDRRRRQSHRLERRPRSAAADVAVEARPDDRVHAHAVRAGVPVRRRGDGRGRALQGQRPAAAAGAGRRRDRDRDRARLQGRRRSQLLPPSENIFVIKKSGWHPAEFAPTTRRSSGSGRRRPRCSTFRNPKRDVTLLSRVRRAARRVSRPAAAGDRLFRQPGRRVLRGRQRRRGARAHRRVRRPSSATPSMAELRIEVDRRSCRASCRPAARTPASWASGSITPSSRPDN